MDAWLKNYDKFKDVLIFILMVTNFVGISFFILFIISSCVLLKHLKVNILVIINGAILVSDSLVNLFLELLVSTTYSPFLNIDMDYARWVHDMWVWTEPIGRLSNVLCLGYAVGRYVMICGSKKWSQYHSWSIILLYVIIAVLVEFSFPLISKVTNFDYITFETSNTTSIVLSLFYCLKFSIMMFGSILHSLVVRAMNKRLNTSIILLRSLKKHDKAKNCEQIKKFNKSLFILFLVHNVMDVLCEINHIAEPILSIVGFRGVNQQLGHFFYKVYEICRQLKTVEEAAAQVLFPIFHFMFLPSFDGFFQRCCRNNENL